jgi:hypothetical protein
MANPEGAHLSWARNVLRPSSPLIKGRVGAAATPPMAGDNDLGHIGRFATGHGLARLDRGAAEDLAGFSR